ncbi:hypothetical protein [Methanococcus voltae]|uniref:hypothetical protein n=1 Tax=Methanococcus voltae TaxID=2188 RepID=UPI001AE551A2|nr:hypothetical protein [Methanococcus voltae]
MDVSKEKYNYQNGAFSTDICSKIEAEEKDICELEFKTLLGYYNVNFNSIEKLLHEYNIQLAHLYIQKNNINLKYITSETLNEEKKEKFIFEIKELIMDKTNEITVLKQPYQAELHNYQSLLHGITKKNDLEILCEYIVEIVEKVDNPDKDYNILIDEFKEYMVRLGDNNECQDYFLNGLNYHIIPYNYRNIEKIMELRYKVLISIIKNKTNTPGYYELLGYTSIIVYLGTVYNHLIEDKEECKYIKYLIDQILEQYIKYLDELIKLNNLNDRYKQNLVLDEILYFKEGKYNFIEDTTYNEFHTKYELDIKSNNIINTLFYLILKNIYLNYIDKSWINTIVILCKEYGTDDKNRDNISQEYELMYKYRPILFYILYWQENKELKEILDYSEFNEKKEDNLFLKDLTELTYRDIEVYGTHRLHFEKFKRDALKITEEYYKNNEMK